MKTVFTLLILFFLSICGSRAQVIQFSSYLEPYVSLSDPINLSFNHSKLPIEFGLPGIGKLDSLDLSLSSLGLFCGEGSSYRLLDISPNNWGETDYYTQDGSIVKYQLFGSEGSRKLVIQFLVTYAELPGPFEYQVILQEGSNEIKYHYKKCPFAGNEVKWAVGIEADTKDDYLWFVYLEKDPTDPKLYTDLESPLEYLYSGVDENRVYKFSLTGTSLGDWAMNKLAGLEETESGIRIKVQQGLIRARMFDLNGKVLAEGDRAGDYLFFPDVKKNAKGIYLFGLEFSDGSASSLKWENR